MIIANVAAALPGERDLRLVDITIKEGKIAAIKEAKGLKAANRSNTDSEQDADEDILDAKGLFVFPGAIDPHVHFDEPGFTHREDFSARLCGGRPWRGHHSDRYAMHVPPADHLSAGIGRKTLDCEG